MPDCSMNRPHSQVGRSVPLRNDQRGDCAAPSLKKHPLFSAIYPAGAAPKRSWSDLYALRHPDQVVLTDETGKEECSLIGIRPDQRVCRIDRQGAKQLRRFAPHPPRPGDSGAAGPPEKGAGPGTPGKWPRIWRNPPPSRSSADRPAPRSPSTPCHVLRGGGGCPVSAARYPLYQISVLGAACFLEQLLSPVQMMI